MMQIASIRQIELTAMLALPLRRTLHRQLKSLSCRYFKLRCRSRRKLEPEGKKTQQGRTK
jgi:hypothetical protein